MIRHLVRLRSISLAALVACIVALLLPPARAYAQESLSPQSPPQGQLQDLLSDEALAQQTLLGWLFKDFIASKLSTTGSALNPQEMKVLKQYPTLGLILKEATCKALAMSYAICGVETDAEMKFVSQTNDEETDAIRHFIFAGLIAGARNDALATLYTTAHEGPPSEWDERERMDLANNRTGIDWATRTYDVEFTDERIARAALHALKSKRLVVLKNGRTRCADASVFKMTTEEILAKQEQLRGEMEHYFNYCRK